MDWKTGLMYGIGIILGIIVLVLVAIGKNLEDNDK